MRLALIALVVCVLSLPFGFVRVPHTDTAVLTDPLLAHTLLDQGLVRGFPVPGSGVACSGRYRGHPYIIWDTRYGVVGGATCLALGNQPR